MGGGGGAHLTFLLFLAADLFLNIHLRIKLPWIPFFPFLAGSDTLKRNEKKLKLKKKNGFRFTITITHFNGFVFITFMTCEYSSFYCFLWGVLCKIIIMGESEPPTLAFFQKRFYVPISSV